MTQRRDLAAWMSTMLGMLWLGLFPLWQDGSFSRITASKWMGMTVLTAVTALAAVRIAADLLRTPFPSRTFRPGMTHIFAAAFFLLVAGSAAFGRLADCLNDAGQRTVLYGARRYEGLYTQLCYALIFLTLSLRPPDVRRVLDAAGDVLLLMCGVICLQYAGVNVLGLFPEGRSIRTNYEFQGTIGNIDMVSGYVSLVMPALLAGFVTARRGGWLLLASGLAGVMLMLCMEVQSGLIVVGATLFCLMLLALRVPDARRRAALVLSLSLALVTLRSLIGLPWLDGTDALVFPHAPSVKKILPLLAGAALIPAMALLRRRPGKAWPWPRLLCLTAVLAAAALAALYFLPFAQGSGLWEMQEMLHGRPQDAFGSERVGVWRLTLEMSRGNLLFGTGPDTFLYAMDDHLLATGQDLVQRFDNPHNMLLAILSNSGLPAMLAFIGMCCSALLGGLKAAAKSPAALPFLLGCLCYLVQGMFTFSICLVTPMFYAMLGMLTALAEVRPIERKETIAHDPEF